ncbi:MAG: Hpt domain-containing protein [Gallionella sp.]
MMNNASFDQKILAAIKPGLTSSLAEISNGIEQYLASPTTNTPALASACSQLRGLQGVLKMSGLEGLAVFCAELELGLSDNATNLQQLTTSSRDVFRRALSSISKYLNALSAGADNAAVNLFDQYQTLQQLRGLEMSFKSDLFYPNLTVQLPAQILEVAQRSDSVAHLKLLRSQYQQGLMRWLRQDDAVAAAQQMQLAVSGAVTCVPQDNGRAFWWIAQGLFDCLQRNDLPEESNVRKLLSRIDQQMRAIAEGKDGDVQLVVNEMLYIIGMGQTATETTGLIKSLYTLESYLPSQFTLSMADMDRLKADLREQLRGAEEGWERCVQGDESSCEKFKSHVNQLVADSGKLDKQTLLPLAQQIQIISADLNNSEYARYLAVDMAMTLLLLESGVEKHAQLDAAFQDQARILSERMHAVLNSQPEDTEKMARLVELNFEMTQAGVTIPLANEMLANLQRVEQGLNAVFADPNQRGELKSLLRLLNQIHGGLSISSLQPANQLLISIQADVQQLAQSDTAPDADKINTLAEAISRLENYLQHLAYGQKNDEALLTSAPVVKSEIAEPKMVEPETPPVFEVAEVVERVTPVVEQVAPVALEFESTLTRVEAFAIDHTPAATFIPQPVVEVVTEAVAVVETVADVPLERPIIEDQELLDIFLEEAQEVIATIRSNLDNCLSRPDNNEAIVTIRRGFHTFKGSGRMVGLNNLGEVAWNVERALNHWLQTKKPATPELLGFIDTAVLSFAGWVEELGRIGGVHVEASALNKLAQQVEAGQVPAVSVVTQPVATEAPIDILPEFEFMPAMEVSQAEEMSRVEKIPEADALPQMDEQDEEAAAPNIAAPMFDFAAALQAAPDLHLEREEVFSLETVEPAVATRVDSTPMAESGEETVTIGNRTLPTSLFNIASAESMENVALLQEQLDALRSADRPVVQYDLMRAAHTLVGLNQAMGFVEAVDLAHALENWARARLDPPESVSGDQLHVLDEAVAGLGDMVLNICSLQPPLPRHDLIDKVAALDKPAEDNYQAVGLQASEVLKAFTSPEIPPAEVLEPVYEKSVAGRADSEKPAVIDELDTQLLPVFLEEADELSPLISEGLRTWRAQPDNQQHAQLFKRQIHTMKGSSRMVGAMRIGEIAHSMEDRVAAFATESSKAGYWDELEADFDDINALLEELRGGKPAVLHRTAQAAPVEVAQPVAAPVTVEAKSDRRALDQSGERAAAGNMLRVRSDMIDRLVNDAGEMSVARSRVETELRNFKENLLELTSSVARLRQQLREVEIQAEGQMQARVSLAKENAGQFDPLEFDRFTRLQELTRFMNESVHDVQTVQQMLLKKLDETAAVMHGQARLNKELQQRLMSVRMVSFNSISDRLYRIVRQTGKELNKRANLELKGTNAELDRSVLEKMIAPFEHLLRNAIVHGLEGSQERADRGKNPIGEISLSLRQENNEVVFEFSDDGAGLNYVALRTKAIAGGLIRSDEQVSDDQLAQLIFTSGLSTATSITEIAGRGVGMDVVRSEITGLGGRIDVTSKRGMGTQFTIYLPLTLAVTQIVLVRSGEHTYAIPSAMVEQVRQIKSADMEALHQAQKIEWQNKDYPLHYLAQLLSDAEFTLENQPRNPLLILRSGEQRLALHVDELLGNQEAVVKNVGPQLARHAGITGATVLGNGAVVMIVNPTHLAQRISSSSKASRALAVKKLNILPLIMVVDDSLTVRKITTKMLVRAGYQVVTATDGVDALEQLEEFTPDVMLLDIEMPRMDGFALAKELRRSTNTKNMPIIMITSRTADKHREFAMQLGVNTYMGKPYQEDELLQNIADFVAVHK